MLLVAFFSDSEVAVWTDEESIVVSIAGTECELSRREAVELQEAIGTAVSDRREFVRTAGVYRPDGTYAVERRGADSTGNAKVFDSFEAVTTLYDRLPETFDAEAVGAEGVTGSRRHMLVRHFAEHPAFACELTSKSPLRVEKDDDGDSDYPGRVSVGSPAD